MGFNSAFKGLMCMVPGGAMYL